MAQAGNLVVCGNTGDALLENSIYEARLFVRGSVKSLGRTVLRREGDAAGARQLLTQLLERASITDVRVGDFKRYGSARKLYNFSVDHADAYG